MRDTLVFFFDADDFPIRPSFPSADLAEMAFPHASTLATTLRFQTALLLSLRSIVTSSNKDGRIRCFFFPGKVAPCFQPSSSRDSILGDINPSPHCHLEVPYIRR